MGDYVRYDELFNELVLNAITKIYKESHRKGWNVTEIVRMSDGKWLVKWSRDLLTSPVPRNPKDKDVTV